MGWRQSHLQTATAKQNKTKKDCGTKTALTVFVSLFTQAWFTLNWEVSQGIRTARACQFSSCSYLVLFACEDSSVVYTMLAVAFVHGGGGCNQPMKASCRKEEQEEEIQVLPESVRLEFRDCDKTLVGRPGLATSKFLWGQMRCTWSYADRPPAATRQLNRIYLIMSSVSFPLMFLVMSCIPSCGNIFTVKWFLQFFSLVLFYIKVRICVIKQWEIIQENLRYKKKKSSSKYVSKIWTLLEKVQKSLLFHEVNYII